MSDPARQHPAAALAKVVEIVRQNFVTILVVLLAGGASEEALWNLVGIGGVALVLLVWGVLDWLRFTYRVEEGELRIEQGVMVRKKLFLSPERIQVIDITSGMVQRLFGLVQLEVKTAGSTSKEAKISALSREKAQQLQQILREAAESVRGDSEEETAEAEEVEKEKPVYRLNMRDLLIAASTSGRFGVALSIVGTVFSQVDQVISEEQMLEYFRRVAPSMSSVNVIVVSVVAVIVVSWLFAFLSTIIKYYGFQVEVGEKELVISRGLLEKKQLTVPFNRIQAVQIREGLLRQPIGYASITLESAGYGDESGNTATLFPLLPRTEATSFIRKVVPEYLVEVQLESPPKIALRRYLLRMTWFALPVVLLVWWLIPYGRWAWLLLPPAWFLGWSQYRTAGVGSSGRTLVVCSRTLGKSTAIVRKYRIQAAEISQNPLQSRHNLVDFQVTVASGSQGASFRVRELNRNTGMKFWEWSSARPPEVPERFQGVKSPS